MKVDIIKSLFLKHKESSLSHRYITNNHIKPLLKNLENNITVEVIGASVLKESIYGLKIGQG